MKRCFVIAPFGSADSKIRHRAEQILSILDQAVSPRGYSCARTIDDPSGGPIMNQIIQEIREADLVVADLSNLNPNVMYELALRHATGKPYIHIIEQKTKIPFDISTYNSIEIDPNLEDVERVLGLVEKIGAQVDKIEKGGCDFSNPVMSPKGDLLVQYFLWEVSFVERLHKSWLELQEHDIQRFIYEFEKKDVDLLKATEPQRNKLAEYRAMHDRASSTMRGNMFYFFNRYTGAIMEGWVVFDETMPPLAIQIRGEHCAEHIHLRYTQPGWPQLVASEKINVGPYNYDVMFQPCSKEYQGDLYHPEDFENGKRLVVARTRLLRRSGLILSDS